MIRILALSLLLPLSALAGPKVVELGPVTVDGAQPLPVQFVLPKAKTKKKATMTEADLQDAADRLGRRSKKKK